MEHSIAVRPLGIDISASQDDSLLAALQNADIEIESICGGIGVCGKCRIRVLEGNTSEPTLEEEDHLSEGMLEQGDRLACQTYPLGNLVINIPGSSMQEEQRLQVDSGLPSSGDDPAVRSIDLDLGNITISGEEQLEQALHSAAPSLVIGAASLENTAALLKGNAGKIRAVVRESRLMALTPRTRSPLGVAVDLGSTKVAVFLYDLEQPALLDSRAFLNPQTRYGEDVISRLQFALTGNENAARLKNSIAAALDDNLSQALALTGKEAADVYEMVVVGNTAMHHLFLGLPVRQLAMNPYIPAVDSALELRALDLGLGINPETVVFMPPPIAGFVGSDHLAALTASRFATRPGPCLLIDIGTNTEVALQVDGNISCCSCASGPAFEGGGLSQGMRAAAGAIERVEMASGSGDLVLSVIGACEPTGICGSGVVSAISSMLEKGAVDPTGRLTSTRESAGEAYYCLTPPDFDHAVGITQSDIREIQKAKGAIRAGIDVLLREAGVGYRDLNEVLLAGAFGSYIDAESAVAIALLPPVSIGKIIQVGNAAGAGAQRMLLSQSARSEAEALARHVEYVELATYKGFDLLFAADMFLGEGEVKEHKRRFRIP
jgi:uncharacterized 2Fe-2S/4Fe-4S cluster protein (DUF4445 family)